MTWYSVGLNFWLCACNIAAFYYHGKHHPVNLGAAVFCGICAGFCLGIALERRKPKRGKFWAEECQ